MLWRPVCCASEDSCSRKLRLLSGLWQCSSSARHTSQVSPRTMLHRSFLSRHPWQASRFYAYASALMAHSSMSDEKRWWWPYQMEFRAPGVLRRLGAPCVLDPSRTLPACRCPHTSQGPGSIYPARALCLLGMQPPAAYKDRIGVSTAFVASTPTVSAQF
ncbi:hypothetical protein L1887_54899 [Cichorium endivia]|nr:hypothetical protein L1887_54899 [Cichorium endivia]